MRIINLVLSLLILIALLLIMRFLYLHKGEQIISWYQSITGPQQPANPAIADGQEAIVVPPETQTLAPADKSIEQPQQSTTVYQWLDESGKLQITDSPPENRPYKTVEYHHGRGKQAQNHQPTPNFPQFDASEKTSNGRSEKPNINQRSSGLPDIPAHCQVKYRAVKRLGKKLAKAKNVVESIWLQDYCSALSELIQDGCVIPKKDIKYNRYCPVRYKK